MIELREGTDAEKAWLADLIRYATEIARITPDHPYEFALFTLAEHSSLTKEEQADLFERLDRMQMDRR